ncbi:MAG: hypothetical protein MZV70_06185 [Desulfobacterales bacterium]|nr:hypothetical protein [Desulfobacterales bacterium]
MIGGDERPAPPERTPPLRPSRHPQPRGSRASRRSRTGAAVRYPHAGRHLSAELPSFQEKPRHTPTANEPNRFEVLHGRLPSSCVVTW